MFRPTSDRFWSSRDELLSCWEIHLCEERRLGGNFHGNLLFLHKKKSTSSWSKALMKNSSVLPPLPRCDQLLHNKWLTGLPAVGEKSSMTRHNIWKTQLKNSAEKNSIESYHLLSFLSTCLIYLAPFPSLPPIFAPQKYSVSIFTTDFGLTRWDPFQALAPKVHCLGGSARDDGDRHISWIGSTPACGKSGWMKGLYSF